MASQPTLTTARLVLAPSAATELDAHWTIWRDPAVRRYLFDDQAVERARAAEVLDACLAEGPQGRGLWTIRAPGDATVLGCAGLMPVDAMAEHDRSIAGLVEPIVALAPAVWGRGYAVESLRALVGHAFGALDLPRLAGVTDVPNEASHRMLVRAGFRQRNECPGPHDRVRIYVLERPEPS